MGLLLSYVPFLPKATIVFKGNGRDKFGVDSYDEQQKKKQQGEREKVEKREFTAYKYKGYEAVIIKGKSVFLRIDPDGLKTAEKIEKETRIIIPSFEEEYPYTPYSFSSLGEVGKYFYRAKHETIDSLYQEARSIAFDYNKQTKPKVCLLAIDILCSYFQDRFPTIHYDVIRGANGTGKSTYGDTFEAVGYRPLVLTDPNAANIIRILGILEPGQCTLVSDESSLENDKILVAILKQGYKLRGKTSKVNDYSRRPEFFLCYCLKIIISDKSTNLTELKGVFDRSFEMVVYRGKPRYDIKETTEPQGNPGRIARLERLRAFRKLMLVYRLLHLNDPLPDIDVGVDGREKELVKPILQVFCGSKAQNEVVETLQHFLDERIEKKDTGLEAVVSSITSALLGTREVDRKTNTKEVYLKDVWGELKRRVPGYSDVERDKEGEVIAHKRPADYHTEEYGTIKNSDVSNILHNVLGGKVKRNNDGYSYRFTPDEVENVKNWHVGVKTIRVSLNGDSDNETVNLNEPREPHSVGTPPFFDGNKAKIERQKCENPLYPSS